MDSVIIILGPPGSGKGTQASLLAEKLGMYLFETSKILEREFKEARKFSKKKIVKVGGKIFNFLEEKKKWEKGELCSPPLVTFLVKKNIERLFKQGEKIILSGSPRTLYEAQELLPFLSKLYGRKNIKVILLEVSPETTIFRNSNRKICELMRHSILFTEETKNLTFCPIDGSKLVRRKELDELETIKVRLEEYKERTLPMIDYFKKEKIRVNKINGESTVSQVFNDILKALKISSYSRE